MANLMFLLLLSIIILIIAESVSIRFIYVNELIIDFNFSLFKLTLYPSRNKRQRRKKRAGLKETIKNNFIRAASAKKSLEYLLKHSNVNIHELDFHTDYIDPANFILRVQNISTVILILITYLSLKTESIISEDTFFASSSEDNSDVKMHLDVTLKSTLFNIISAYFIFVLENKRRKGKQVRKIVRNQNE